MAYATFDYRNMSPERAADALAYQEGLEDMEQEARDSFCEIYAGQATASFRRDPLGQFRPDGASAWDLYCQWQADHSDPCRQANSRMLMALVSMTAEQLHDLRTLSGPLADAAELMRRDWETLLLEEAAGEFDTKQRQEGDYD
jgi:hypothetical protein